MHSNLRDKLSPENLQGVQPSTFSVLGVLLNERLTTPAFESIFVDHEGKVFLMSGPDNPMHQVYIGPISNVQAELVRAAALGGLTSHELKTLELLFALRVSGNPLYH